MITCCKTCKNHAIGCHATCETYINEKEIHEKEREELRNRRAHQSIYLEYAQENHRKVERYMRNKKR